MVRNELPPQEAAAPRVCEADAACRANLEHYYIHVWGGMRTNQPKTLEAYHRASAEENIARGKAGIASSSKALCVRDPFKYAIFDARVAASMNALQVIHRVPGPESLRFPLLASRNTVVSRGNAQLQEWFREHAWPRVRPAFYADYLHVCESVAARLGSTGAALPIYAVEMAFFASAEELLNKAFPPTLAG